MDGRGGFCLADCGLHLADYLLSDRDRRTRGRLGSSFSWSLPYRGIQAYLRPSTSRRSFAFLHSQHFREFSFSRRGPPSASNLLGRVFGLPYSSFMQEKVVSSGDMVVFVGF